MDSVSIPENRYAVITHSGQVPNLPKTVYTIWNKALPDAGLEPRKDPDFELYDSRFDPSTGNGDVEIWIPIDLFRHGVMDSACSACRYKQIRPLMALIAETLPR